MENFKKLSDHELALLVQKKNVMANTELFSRYKPYINGFLYKKGINRTDSEDLSMIIFAKIFTKINTFNLEKGSLKSWINKITNNTVIDHYRSRKNKQETVFMTLINHENNEYTFDFISNDKADATLISKQTLKILYSAINQLPIKYKIIVELLIEEKNINEISKITGIKPNAIGVQKFRALKQLNEILLTLKIHEYELQRKNNPK